MMENLVDNTIKAIPVTQNKQDFLVGVFRIQQVLKFTKYTRRLIVGYDEEERPIYNDQIQRYVEVSRVKKIADFLMHDPDASFPTNLVLHIPKSVILQQYQKGEIVEIQLNQKVFDEIEKEYGDVYISIIDGQHRIRGIELAISNLQTRISDLSKTLRLSPNTELSNKLMFYRERLMDLKNIQLMVTFFVDKTLEYQAMIFSTINRTQKKVSADLVSSLFGLNTGDTPQKTALQVVLELNGHRTSPFFKRIKLYGGTYSKDNSPPLSQATMVSSIVRLISENLRESETDRYKKRKELHKRSSGSTRFLPFRIYYANNRDDIISDILYYYFDGVRKSFLKNDGLSYWDFPESSVQKPTNILQTTVGYDTLLKILVEILEKGIDIAAFNDANPFLKLLRNPSKLDFGDITRYSFNNRGKKILYLEMSLSIWPPNYRVNEDDTREEDLAKLMREL